jgi:large subunit ribosomal protein L15
MTEHLARVAPPPGARKASKRVGRGQGSGLGTTCGRGQKGQKARKPGNIRKLHFQGGQTPIQRRLPKRGFNNPFPIVTVVINVGDLETFPAGSTVDEAALRQARMVQGVVARIKVLGDGSLTKKLTVSAHRFSKSATTKIEGAGGKVVVVPELPSAAEQKAE